MDTPLLPLSILIIIRLYVLRYDDNMDQPLVAKEMYFVFSLIIPTCAIFVM